MVFHRHSSHTHTFVSFLSVFLFLFFFFFFPTLLAVRSAHPPKKLTHPLVFKCSMQHQQRSGETRQQQNSPFLFFSLAGAGGEKSFVLRRRLSTPSKSLPFLTFGFAVLEAITQPPPLIHPHLLARGAVNCESSGSSEGSPSEFRHLIYTYSILLLTQAVPHPPLLPSPPSPSSFPSRRETEL